MWQSNTVMQLATWSLIALEAIAKGYQIGMKYTLEQIACGIGELHATLIM
jgi:hypothetical protein